MIRHDEPYPDPLIDEVRERRRALFADLGNDLRKLFEAVRRRQARHPEKIVDRRKGPRRAATPEK